MKSKTRKGLFGILTIFAIAIMLVGWFIPWWKCHVIEVDSWMVIRPWALQTTLPEQFDSYIEGSTMPVFFAPLMWIFLALCVLALVMSMFVKNKPIKIWKINTTLPQLLIGFVGIGFAVVCIAMIVVAAIRTGDFYGTKLLGYSHVEIEYPIETGVDAALYPGFWLACGTSVVCILLALFRNKIIGVSKND